MWERYGNETKAVVSHKHLREPNTCLMCCMDVCEHVVRELVSESGINSWIYE